MRIGQLPVFLHSTDSTPVKIAVHCGHDNRLKEIIHQYFKVVHRSRGIQCGLYLIRLFSFLRCIIPNQGLFI